MLDLCIEIPQYGVIRSLNVHVSGSILLWEYISFEFLIFLLLLLSKLSLLSFPRESFTLYIKQKNPINK